MSKKEIGKDAQTKPKSIMARNKAIQDCMRYNGEIVQ